MAKCETGLSHVDLRLIRTKLFFQNTNIEEDYCTCISIRVKLQRSVLSITPHFAAEAGQITTAKAYYACSILYAF